MGILDPNCPCSPEAVDLAFRESEQFIDRQIADRTYMLRRFMVDMAPVREFPDGVGYDLAKIRFYGDIGPQWDGFDGWREEARSRSAFGHRDAHDACGYNWEVVGHGFEQLHYKLMTRDLKTIPICVHDIRNFWEYQQFQNLIFKNLTEITANQREQLNRNSLIGFSVKHVITSAGLQVNPQNPYQLPNLTGVTLGRLNYRVATRLYNALLREAGAYALEVIDGRPVFGLIGSDETFDDLFMETPEIRQDLRDSSFVDDLLKRYNFRQTLRGLFLLMPDMYAPRYKLDAAGNLIRVFPYERDVMIESGTRPAPNPEYETAPFELLIVLTKDPFALRARRAISTVGGETNFEAETGMFEWKWHNPERWCDPNRRIGFYYANGRIGIEPGDFTDMPAVLVQRRPVTLDAAFWPAAVCPPTPVNCDNELAAQGCPCPQVVDCCEDFTSNQILQLKFSSPITEVAEDPITIRLANGGTATGTVVAVSADAKAASIDFGEPVQCEPGFYVEVLCVAIDVCSADVVIETQNATNAAHRDLRLEQLLKATAIVTATVTAILDTGEAVDVVIEAIDTDSVTYTVSSAEDLTGKCIKVLCIPPALDAACPACQPALVACDPQTGI